MSAPIRHRDGFERPRDIVIPTRDDPTQVVCPTCGSKALVLPLDGDAGVRAVCTSCGFSRENDGTVRGFSSRVDGPSDGYFGLALWMQTRCMGHILSAFNRRHLDLLEGHISATLRERRQDGLGWRNASITSRLPSWMTKGSNRDEVVAALQILRERA